MTSFRIFQSIAKRMELFAGADDVFSGAATGQEILEAEKVLGVTFPISYKWFLQRFGAAGMPFQIAGIGPETYPLESNHSYQLVVAITQSERMWPSLPLPPNLVAISPNGSGDYWCLDVSQMAVNECPVVFRDHADGAYYLTHTTFLEYLEYCIDFEEQAAAEEEDD